MTRITAHDVAALTRLNAEVQRWNEENPASRVDTSMDGPTDGWEVFIVTRYGRINIANSGTEATLGDAINAALDAWKEARGRRQPTPVGGADRNRRRDGSADVD
jgi:hypothetical protein